MISHSHDPTVSRRPVDGPTTLPSGALIEPLRTPSTTGIAFSPREPNKGLTAMRVRVARTPVLAPRADSISEHRGGTLCRECTGLRIPLDKRQVKLTLPVTRNESLLAQSGESDDNLTEDGPPAAESDRLQSSRRCLLQSVFMKETAQHRRSASDVSEGDAMTTLIRRRRMRERCRYPGIQSYVGPAAVAVGRIDNRNVEAIHHVLPNQKYCAWQSKEWHPVSIRCVFGSITAHARA